MYSRLLNTQSFLLQPQTESGNVSNMPDLHATLLRSCVILHGHILQSTGTTYHSFKLRPPPNRKRLINNLFFFEERSKFETTLTNVCCVNSNVYDLHNIHWIRYLTAVDPILSTSSAVQTNHHVTSASVDMATNGLGGNSGFIWEIPVSYGRPISTSIRMMATSSEVSYAE